MRRLPTALIILAATMLSPAGAQQAPLPPPTAPDAPLFERAQYDMAAYQELIAAGFVPSAVTAIPTEPARIAPRASFEVSSSEDTPDSNPGDGQCNSANGCTLRAAIMETNALGSGIITFADTVLDVVLAPLSTTDTEANGDLDITGTAFIVGRPDRRITIHGLTNARAIEVASGGVLNLSHISVEGGNAGSEDGGCLAVQSGGAAVLEYVTLQGCTARIGGGAYVGSGAYLRASHSAIVGNTAQGASGVGSTTSDSGAHIVLEYSEISGNLSTDGAGAILSANGWLTLDHVTIAYNTTQEPGNAGGIVIVGTGQTMITNTTLAYNQAVETAAGLQVLGPTPPVVSRSIIAHNTRTAGGTPADCTGPGVSFASIAVYDTTLAGTGCADVSPPPLLLQIGVDPKVSPALDMHGAVNGTRTLALLPDSPAVDAAGYPCGPRDQRGEPISGGACDLGAFELHLESRGADMDFEDSGGCVLSTLWKSKLSSDKPAVTAPIEGACSFRFKGKGGKALTPGSLKFSDKAPVTPGSVDGFRWTFTAQTTTATNASWKIKVIYADGTSKAWSGALPAVNQTASVTIGDMLPVGKPSIVKAVYKLTDRTLSGTWQLDGLAVWLTRSG